MAEPRIIKRYANRKLYDTQHSRYVTLDQISEMIRIGDDVKIVDNKTKEDLTTVTLAQIIFEEEKKQRSFLPLSAMRNIIQNGGEWFAEAQRQVQSILPGKRRDDGSPAAEPTAVAEAGRRGRGDAAPRSRSARAWPRSASGSQHSKSALDDWQRRIDERIRGAIGTISPFAGVNKDIKTLADRIAELEAKLEQLAADGHDDRYARAARTRRAQCERGWP